MLPASLALALVLLQDPAVLIEQGKFAEAEQLLRVAVREQPADVGSLMLLGVVLDQQKRCAEAEPFYQQALKLAPRAVPVLNNTGNHFIACGKPAEARSIFLRVIAVEPHHANANLQLAQIASADRRWTDALRCLDRLKAPEGDAAAVQLLRARALAGAGRSAEAAALASRLEKSTEGDPRAAFSLGMLYADWKEYARAEEAFSRALKAAPANYDILYNLGVAATGAGHLERAREVLETALRLKPDDPDCLYALARTQAQAGNNEMALTILVRARQVAPERLDILEFLARASEALGYYGDAALAWNEYLKRKPDDEVARRERGFANARGGNLDDGLADLRWFAARRPADLTGQYELAIAETVREPEKAFERLNRCLASKPDYLPALFARGIIQLQQGRSREALADLELVAKKELSNMRAWDRIGQAYLHLDQPQPAVQALAQAVRLAPNDPKVLMHYSQALRGVGRIEEARSALARFRALGPDQARRLPYAGIVDFLSLPPAEQRARYFENLKKATAANPGDAGLQLHLGKEWLAQGDPKEAEAAFRRARALAPDPRVAADIGRTLLKYEQYALAREFLSEAAGASPDLQLDLAIAAFHAEGPEAGLASLEKIPPPERKGDYYLVRAQVLDGQGKFEEAVESLNRGFRAAPTRPDLYLEASLFLLKHQRYREADDLLRQATRLLPDVPELRLTHAITLELLRRTEDAIKLLAEAQLRWPEWDRTYLVQGIILDINKKPAEARQAIETAIALGAHTPEAYFFLAQTITETAPEDLPRARQAIGLALDLNAQDPYIRALAGKLAYNGADYRTAVEHLREAVRLFPDFLQAHYNLANTYRAIGEEEKALAELREVRRIRETHPRPELETPPLPAVLFPVRRPN